MRISYLFVFLCFSQMLPGQIASPDTLKTAAKQRFAVTVDRDLSSLLFHFKRKKNSLKEHWWRLGLTVYSDGNSISPIFLRGSFTSASVVARESREILQNLTFLVGKEKRWAPIHELPQFKIMSGVDVIPWFRSSNLIETSTNYSSSIFGAQTVLYGGVHVFAFRHLTAQIETAFSVEYARYWQETSVPSINYRALYKTNSYNINYYPIRAIRLGFTF